MSIFVAIASYRDPRLWKTVQDCLSKAADPSALHFGVVEQSDLPSPMTGMSDSRMRYIHVDQHFSRGTCWARSLAFGLYRDEDFLLQIDSHMLFAVGWDKILVAWMERLLSQTPHAIISSYPFPFVDVGGKIEVQAITGHALVLRPRSDSKFKNGSPILRFEGFPIKTDKAILGFHVAAGCLFTQGAFVNLIPYDPRLYFHGEEQNLTVRAWTRGWNLFHIPNLPIYHLYKEIGPSTQVHWNVADDLARKFRYSELETQSLARLRDLLVLGRDLGAYGLGTARSLADFAEFSGINYSELVLRRIQSAESSGTGSV